MTNRALVGAARSDDGSILPLAIVFGALSLALVLVVVAASSLYLERKRLFTVADGAALAAAEGFELAEVSAASDGSLQLSLSSEQVAAVVEEYLDDARMGEFDDLRVVDASSADGQSATVTLSAYWRPPVVSVFVPDGFPVEVTAVARAVFGE